MEPWFYGEALPSWAGCFISFCLTDVLFFFFFFLHSSVVNDQSFNTFHGLICKPHHHWTQHNVAAPFIWISLLLLCVFVHPVAYQQRAVWCPKVRSVFRDVSTFCHWGLLSLKCYHSFTGREKKTLQPLAMHLTETSISSPCRVNTGAFHFIDIYSHNKIIFKKPTRYLMTFTSSFWFLVFHQLNTLYQTWGASCIYFLQ